MGVFCLIFVDLISSFKLKIFAHFFLNLCPKKISRKIFVAFELHRFTSTSVNTVRHWNTCSDTLKSIIRAQMPTRCLDNATKSWNYPINSCLPTNVHWNWTKSKRIYWWKCVACCKTMNSQVLHRPKRDTGMNWLKHEIWKFHRCDHQASLVVVVVVEWDRQKGKDHVSHSSNINHTITTMTMLLKTSV